MKTERNDLWVKGYHRYLEGEGDGGGTDPNQGEEVTLLAVKDAKTGQITYRTSDGKPFFTQEHMNTEIGNARKEARKKVETEKSELQSALEEMRAAAEEKGQNVDALSEKIKELEEQSMTAEELASKRATDLEKQFTVEREALKKEANQAMELFRNERITTEISQACSAHKAVSMETIAPLVRVHTELVAEKNAKKEVTGYKAVVHFPDKDDDGKDVIRDLSISDAVKRMREMPDRFGHLFLHETEPGSGQTTLLGQPQSSANSPLLEGKVSQDQFNKWAEAEEKAGRL